MKTHRFASDFSVGFVLFVATVVIVASLFLVGDGQGLFRDSARFRVRCPNAQGIKDGSTVKLDGVAVGAVETIELPPELNSSDVLFTFTIDRRYLNRIREDSFAWLESQGLLGDTELHLRSGTQAETQAQPGSLIRFRSRAMLDSLAGEELSESTTDLIQNMVTLLEDINRGKGTLGQLLKNPELYNNLSTFTKSMGTTTLEVEKVSKEVGELLAEIRNQKGTLGKLLFSDEYARSITSTLEEARILVTDLRHITDGLKDGKGTAGKLLTDGTLHDEAKVALDRVGRSAEQIEAALAKAQAERSVVGRLLVDGELGARFTETVARFEGSLEHLERILARVENGEGSLGVLVQDPSIATSLRDIFLGVREAGLMKNVLQNAERAGREAYLRDQSLTRKEAEEVLRVRALSAIKEQQGEDAGTPVPAAGPAEDNKDD